MFQAYAQRYVVGPDGVAYLDLSDAVVAGHWSGLVNLYWSPLYPLLIGLARIVTRASPAGEVPVDARGQRRGVSGDVRRL